MDCASLTTVPSAPIGVCSPPRPRTDSPSGPAARRAATAQARRRQRLESKPLGKSMCVRVRVRVRGVGGSVRLCAPCVCCVLCAAVSVLGGPISLALASVPSAVSVGSGMWTEARMPVPRLVGQEVT